MQELHRLQTRQRERRRHDDKSRYVMTEIEIYGEMQAEQDLVAVGYVALGGTEAAARAGEELLCRRFSPVFVEQCKAVMKTRGFQNIPGVLQSQGAEGIISSWCFPGEGGILAALWRYFDVFELGFEMDLRRLPVLQETIEVCEVLDLNPYRLYAKGSALLTARSGAEAVLRLKGQGIYGRVVGRTRKTAARILHSGDVTSFLDRPKPDELYKIQLQRFRTANHNGEERNERENFSGH
ncbi:MAG: hypothetical protein ACOYA8_07635 [Clostridium sp.]|jgi:hydrogenase expression/formation protein HypE